MPKFNHAFTLAFSIETDSPCDTEDNSGYPTEAALFAAAHAKLDDLRRTPGDLHEAIGTPFDTYIID